MPDPFKDKRSIIVNVCDNEQFCATALNALRTSPLYSFESEDWAIGGSDRFAQEKTQKLFVARSEQIGAPKQSVKM
jgi:hypothetical protein